MPIDSQADISPVYGMRRLRRGRELERSLTLLRVFLLASALICAGAAVGLGWLLSHSLMTEALNAEQTALARYAEGVVRPLIHGDHVGVIEGRDKRHLAESVQTGHPVGRFVHPYTDPAVREDQG